MVPGLVVVAALEETGKPPRSPAPCVSRRGGGGLRRPRPLRGRPAPAPPSGRPGPVPGPRAAARQPRPRRPGLRAGPGRRGGPAPWSGRAAPRPARRTGPRELVRQRDLRRRDRLPGPGRRRGAGREDRHRRRPLHRRAGRAHRRLAAWTVVPEGLGGVPARRPVHVLADDGPRGRGWSVTWSASGCTRSATSPTFRPRPWSTGWAPTVPSYDAGREARTPRRPSPPHSAARASRPTCPSKPALDSVEAITLSVRTTAERFVAQLAHRQLVATRVRVEAESDGVICSSRTWLHPRHFAARDIVDRVHWRLQSADVGGSLRARKDSGRVRAPIDLIRFVPEVVESAAAHGEAVRHRVGRPGRRGVARVQGMIGFDAVRRPVLQGGRSPAARQALVPWASAPSTCARSTGRGRDGCRVRPPSGCSRLPRPPRSSTTPGTRSVSPSAAS